MSRRSCRHEDCVCLVPATPTGQVGGTTRARAGQWWIEVADGRANRAANGDHEAGCIAPARWRGDAVAPPQRRRPSTGNHFQHSSSVARDRCRSGGREPRSTASRFSATVSDGNARTDRGNRRRPRSARHSTAIDSTRPRRRLPEHSPSYHSRLAQVGSLRRRRVPMGPPQPVTGEQRAPLDSGVRPDPPSHQPDEDQDDDKPTNRTINGTTIDRRRQALNRPGHRATPRRPAPDAPTTRTTTITDPTNIYDDLQDEQDVENAKAPQRSAQLPRATSKSNSESALDTCNSMQSH